MEPFAISKIIRFVYNRLKLDQVKDKSKCYDKEIDKLFEKGENHVRSDHIRRFTREEPGKVAGLVDPSYGGLKIAQKTTSIKSYTVWVRFDSAEGPSESYCSCPVGNFLCSHAVGLMLFAQKMLSRTDFESVWSRPRCVTGPGSKERICDIWKPLPIKPALSSPIKKADLIKMKSLVNERMQFGLCWLLEDEAIGPKQTYQVQSWLTEEAFLTNPEKKSWILEKFKLDAAEIAEICSKTLGQRENPLWLQLRKHRLTASTFGLVLTQMRKAIFNFKWSFPTSLFKTLLGEYKLEKVKAIGYGIDHEDDAIQLYVSTTGNNVHPAGLHLMDVGFIGASPDGLIDNDGIIEVKCPYTGRNKTFEEFILSKTCYLFKNSKGEVKLKEDHSYYHQVQGTLYATNRLYCDFVCWSPKWSIVTRIFKSDDWIDELTLIKTFYKDIFMDVYLESNEYGSK